MEQDILRLRKELHDLKEVKADLQDELQFAEERYHTLKEEFDEREEIVQRAREDLSNLDFIVEKRVNERLEDEITRRERLEELVEEKDKLIARLRDEEEKLLNEKRMLIRDNEYLKSKSGIENVDMRDILARRGRQQDDRKEREVEHLTIQLNELSKQTENLIAENRVLREMAGTPDNFGIPINEIKLAEREKIEEYKTKLQYYEREIHSLERERAVLRARLRERPRILGKEDFTKNLTPDQIIKVENFIFDLRQEKDYVSSEMESLRRENDQLKMEILRLQRNGSDDLKKVVENAIIKKSQGQVQDVEGGLLEKIKQENAELLRNLHELLNSLNRGGPVSPPQTAKSFKDEAGLVKGSRLTYPPEPVKQPDGSIAFGKSHRLPGSKIPIVPFNIERYNGDRITKEEFAFLQLCLIEAIELNTRKDSELKVYTGGFDRVRTKIKNYILQRNELYKDYARIVTGWKRDENSYKEQTAELTDLLRAERIKNSDLEKLLDTLKQDFTESELKERLIETTKKSSIIEISLMQLTKKYMTLQQEYKIMHDQYMNLENDNKDKEVQLEERIVRLKEWKVKATLELKYLYNKLRTSVSSARYERQREELEALKGKELQWLNATKELILLKSDYVGLERARVECEKVLQEAETMLIDSDQELQLLQARLKRKDLQYAYERAVIERVIDAFKVYRVSLDELFESYDKARTGSISQDNFKNILELLHLNLPTTELEVVMKFIDLDALGMVRYRSFIRTLKRYGVKIKRREEEIIAKAAAKMKQTGIDLKKAFELVDRDKNQLISKSEMLDALLSMGLGIQEDELQSAINYIYPEGISNLDYRRFCRVFERSAQVLLKEEEKEKEKWKIEVLEKIDEKMMEERMSLHNAFAVTPEGNVTKEEFAHLCDNLMIPLSSRQLDELYDDFDKRKTGVAAFSDIAAAIILAKVNRGAGKVDIKDTEFDPRKYNEENNIEALRSKVAILQEREKIALNKLRREGEQVEMLQNLVKQRSEDCANLDRNYHKLSENHFRLQKLLVEKDALLVNCITREESLELRRKYETAERDLLDKDAAMQTYKVMYEALLQQMKSLELAFGRKRDENFHLHKALLDVQSANDKDNLLGKLYYVVLLSRWQEGTTNRKYEELMTDAKRLRQEVYSNETTIVKKEKGISHLEARLQDSTELISQLNDKLREQDNAEDTRERVRELTGRLKEVVQVKIDTELANITLREKNTNLTFLIDQLELEKRQAQELVEVLRSKNDNEIAMKYGELSNKVGAIKLGELRAQKDTRMAKERVLFLEKVNNEYIIQIHKLEEELGGALSKLQKAEEAYREKDKERERLFFELRQVKDTELPLETAKESVAKKSIRESPSAPPIITPVSEEEKGTANAELVHLLREKDEQLRLKNDLVNQLRNDLENARKDSNLGREFRESIVFTKIDVELMQEEQKREMTDVAFKTIRTLEKIIENQKEQLKRKNNYIKEIRNESANKSGEMLREIARLQKDLALQTQRVMEMPAITTKFESHKGSSNADILGLTEVTTELMRKDGTISELTKKLRIYADELENKNQEINEVKSKNMLLEERIASLDQKEKVEQVQRDLARTKKELEKRTKDYNGLKDTIEKLRNEFEAYTSVNIKNVEDTNTYAAKEKPYDHGKAILEQQLRHTQRELQQQTKVLAKAQAKMNELNKKNKELKNEIDKLKTQLEEERKLHYAAQKKLEEGRSKPKVVASPIKEEVKASHESEERIEELNKEIKRLKKELSKKRIEERKMDLKVNMEKAVIESTTIKDITDVNYIDEIIGIARENIQPEISPIDVFDAYSEDNGLIPKDKFEEVCEKIGLRFDLMALEMLMSKLKSDEEFVYYKEFAYAVKGVFFEQFIDSELLQLGQVAVDRNVTETDLVNHINDSITTEEDIENAMQTLFNITAENKVTKYILKRIKDPNKLLSLIEEAIKVNLTEIIRKAVRRADTEPDLLFAEADTDYDKKITLAQLEKLLNNIRVHVPDKKYLQEIFDSKNTGVIEFDTYCLVFMLRPELCIIN